MLYRYVSPNFLFLLYLLSFIIYCKFFANYSFQSPPTEEEVIARCKSAIAEGLSLVNRSYERHEIQDSDSDEEDSPSRFADQILEKVTYITD